MIRTFKITVKRQDSASDKPYLQTFAYSCDGRITVADFLRELNAQDTIVDIEGHEVLPVVWECACFPKNAEPAPCGSTAIRLWRVPFFSKVPRMAEVKSCSNRLESFPLSGTRK